MGRVKFVLNLISFSSSLLGPIFYFYIYVSSSVLSYCSIKHDDDDDDDHDVYTLDIIGAKDNVGGGGNNWSYKTCRAPVKSSPTTTNTQLFLRGWMPFLSPSQQCQSTEGIKQYSHLMTIKGTKIS